jgi:hypothetical protein
VSAANSGYGPDPDGVQRPSLAGRVAVGVLVFILLAIVCVGLPEYALQQLNLAGATSAVTTTQVALGGLVLSALWAVTYVLRPTGAYGGAGMARAAATSAYFLLLAPFASVTVPVGHSLTATISYGDLLVVLAILPIFGFMGSLLVLLSDRHDLDTRLRLEFPARWMATRAEYVDPPTVNRAASRR